MRTASLARSNSFSLCSSAVPPSATSPRSTPTSSAAGSSKASTLWAKSSPFAEMGSMDYAASVFLNIENPDGFLFNSMIRGFSRINQGDRAFYYYKKMLGNGESADNFTFSFLLKLCGQLGFVRLGKGVHCCSLKMGFGNNVFVRNTLIHMYGMVGEFEVARKLFDGMPDPDLVAWNSMIDCHVHCGHYKEAIELFSGMLRCDVKPDGATFVVTLAACSALGHLDFGRWVHSVIRKTSLVDVVPVCNALIDMYSKCGAIDEACDAFYKMSKRDIVSWNTIILAVGVHGHVGLALTLFERLLRECFEAPNDVTFLGVLCACSHGGMVEEGRRYFDSMRMDYNIQPTIKHYGCMVDILGRAGLVEEAYRLIKGMPIERNAVVWRTLLGACRVHGNVELGEKVRVQLLDLEPDHSSDYVLLANMYGSKGKWDHLARVRNTMGHRGVRKPEPGNSWQSSQVVEAG